MHHPWVTLSVYFSLDIILSSFISLVTHKFCLSSDNFLRRLRMNFLPLVLLPCYAFSLLSCLELNYGWEIGWKT